MTTERAPYDDDSLVWSERTRAPAQFLKTRPKTNSPDGEGRQYEVPGGQYPGGTPPRPGVSRCECSTVRINQFVQRAAETGRSSNAAQRPRGGSARRGAGERG